MDTQTRRTPLQLALARLGACHEARVWAGRRTIHQIWDQCHRGEWMLWLASELQVEQPAVIAILDWLQARLCCIRSDIPAALAALSEQARSEYLWETAQLVRGQISSGEIARKMGL